MPSMKRVVVTGIGAVSAAGIGAERLWAAARDGRSCAAEPRFPRPYKGRIRIAAQVQDFVAEDHLEKDVLPFCDPVSQYLLVAGDEAIRQAGYPRDTRFGPRGATVIGTGIGGMTTIEDGLYLSLVGNGRPNPLMIPKLIPSACPANLSMRYGLQGPCFAVASACSSAAQAIGMGFQFVRAGVVDVALVGGTEDCITNNSMYAWESLRVMTPNLCRPFSKGRNGMILGAGAGVLVIESEDHAKARGATILGEIAGYGTSTDAKDPVSPDAHGASEAMRLAIEDAGIHPRDVDYVNAHGTATVVNDATESAALHMVFGAGAEGLPVSSTKPIHGHGLGASGALEAVVTLSALRDQVAPPTINFQEPDEKCRLDVIPNVARNMPIGIAMSNSFAFGGINAALIFRAAGA